MSIDGRLEVVYLDGLPLYVTFLRPPPGKTIIVEEAMSNGYSRSDGLRADEMICPECGKIARCESVDVGVGLYIKGDFSCVCGWESDADGKANVASYDDWFIDDHIY